MTSNERRETAGCCGVDFAALGSRGSGWRWPAATTSGMVEGPDAGSDAPPACPMAAMCRRMTRGRRFGLFVRIAGITLLALGLAIAWSPKLLTWLVARRAPLCRWIHLVTAFHTHRADRGAA